MEVILIYSPEDAERNREYIEIYRQECRRRGLKFTLMLRDEEEGRGVNDFRGEDKLYLNRSRDWRLSEKLAKAGLRVMNSPLVCRLGNDKLAAYEWCVEKGIPVMKTAETPFCFPCVMKSRDGHGGSEVFMAGDREAAEKIKAEHPGKSFIFQEPCDTPGRDLRLYIIGNRIAAGMLRTSDRDFRSNFSLGGKAVPHEADEAERAVAEAVMKELWIDNGAIDLIYHEGRPVFNELEDAAGSRMLYKYTDIDIVSLFLDRL